MDTSNKDVRDNIREAHALTEDVQFQLERGGQANVLPTVKRLHQAVKKAEDNYQILITLDEAHQPEAVSAHMHYACQYLAYLAEQVENKEAEYKQAIKSTPWRVRANAKVYFELGCARASLEVLRHLISEMRTIEGSV